MTHPFRVRSAPRARPATRWSRAALPVVCAALLAAPTAARADDDPYAPPAAKPVKGAKAPRTGQPPAAPPPAATPPVATLPVATPPVATPPAASPPVAALPAVVPTGAKAPAVTPPATTSPAPPPGPGAAPAGQPATVTTPAPALAPGEVAPPTLAERAALKKKAAELYKRGRELLERKKACDPSGPVAETTEALHAFVESLGLLPRPGTTYLAGVCHKALDHVDEALELFEGYLRLPDARDDTKVEAQKAVVELRARVGTIVVEGSENGAKIVVDGRARGEFPPPAPLNSSTGKHLVQVYREGFSPFEATIGVVAGDVTKVEAHLERLAKVGRLSVIEKSGQVMDVVVDGNVLGRTPWTGELGPGPHGVSLRGSENVGSSPTTVTVGDQPATVTLAAERLDATLRIVPEPSGATVQLDDAFVGHGSFTGHLRPGEHALKVLADGFFATTQKVTVDRGPEQVVRVVLKKDPSSPLWKAPDTFVPQASAGPPKWAWLAGGAGLVAVGTAVVFGIEGLSATSALKTACGGQTSPCVVSDRTGVDTLNGEKDRDLGLFIGFGVAGVAATTLAAVKILTAPKAAKKASDALVLTPAVGPGFGGASLGGRF